jgi:hypothetical protein
MHAAQAQISLPINVTNTYAAKFICGVQPNSNISFMPDVQAGRYSTKINVHNNTGVPINFRKKIIRLNGGEVSTAPTWKSPGESLNADEALEVVCQDIYGYLGIGPPAQGDGWRYVEGFVIFEVYILPKRPPPPPDPLDVEGVYTYKGDLPFTTTANGVSINVVVFPAKSNGHVLQ